MHADVTALILAGGQARRLGGVDKRTLVVGGRTIFERQVAVLAPRVAAIVVSSPRPIDGYLTVADAIADGGPLAGIAAGLASATTPWLFVLAGDMPFVSGALVELVLAARRDDADAVGIRIGGLPEPLVCALRVATCRPAVDARLAARRLKASRLLAEGDLPVAWIEEAAVRALDPELRVLANVNTPADLATGA